MFQLSGGGGGELQFPSLKALLGIRVISENKHIQKQMPEPVSVVLKGVVCHNYQSRCKYIYTGKYIYIYI